jgi:hypothetical protein
MIGIPYAPNTTNSSFGGASWSWTLPSNNLSPCGRPKNLANIVDLLDFPSCPPNESHWQ